MDREPNRPLTPDEAKARLRAAAAEVGVAPLIRRHPVTGMAAGAAIGYLVGSLPPRTRRRAGSILLRGALNGFRSILD